MKNVLMFLFVLAVWNAHSQPLPLFSKSKVTVSSDWLVEPIKSTTQLYQTPEGRLVLSNGLISRTFTKEPNCATVGVDLLSTNESFLRSVNPEAEVTIDGMNFHIGGLIGQPIQNYLLPKWISELKADPISFKLEGYEMGPIKERFPWKKQSRWISSDMPWPQKGKELIFTYRLDEQAIKLIGLSNLEHLLKVVVKVHYEMADGLPVISKWISVDNQSDHEIRISSFKSEILAVPEPESTVDNRKNWLLPNITVESDYNFGGMTEESICESSIEWKKDPRYTTQVNYEKLSPCLLEVAPKIGPDHPIPPHTSWSSYRVWELFHDSWDRERKGLAHRRMIRAVAPWIAENPILMHVRNADSVSVKKAIDQCAEVGFEMVIMTFGSGFNPEDTTSANILRLKRLTDYAHSKKIALGGYSLLASRSINKENDVVMPEGKTPRFGNSPCLGSKWGISYFQQLKRLFDASGMDVLEHDGSYPGDVCASTVHPGHKGLEDSQWNQYEQITSFYRYCRSKGIYLNVPDYYFFAGSNKTGMGYRETNWSLPREQQEIIERQNIYDGTWQKTPSMGWMFVPLVEYQGGGEAATIEPLVEHLTHYGQRLANLFGAGVQACYRGPQLYDAPETRLLVSKWVSFYKTHRQVLDGDIIHLRRPDGNDYDAIFHVNPTGPEKGLLMVYNPLGTPIERTLKLNLYYTGIRKSVKVEEADGHSRIVLLEPNNTITIKVILPARGERWFVLKSN